MAKELHRIEIRLAENGCIVDCTHRTPSKSKRDYDGYTYETKTHTAPMELIDSVKEHLSEAVEEKPKKKGSYGRVTKIG